MSVKVQGNTSGQIAEVDTNNQVKVALTTTKTSAGFAALSGVADEGLLTNTRIARQLEVTPDFRLRVGVDNILFQEHFSGSVLNTSLWGTPNTNSTASQAAGILTLNAGSSTTSANGIILRCHHTFPVFATFPLYCEMLLNVPNLSFNNASLEWGNGIIGAAVGTGATDGGFFRLNSVGLYCVMVTNGSEISAVLVDPTRMSNNSVVLTNTNHYIVAVDEDQIVFYINNMVAAKIARYATGMQSTQSMQLSPFIRQYNSGTNTLTALSAQLMMVTVSNGDSRLDLPFSHRMSAGGNVLFQKFTGYGSVGRTALWNDWTTLPLQLTAIAQATYGGTASLGGIQRLGNGGGTIALSADTAYILYSFQTPALVVTNPITPAKNLVLTGIKITCSNRGAVGPGGICTFIYTLMVGCNNVDPKTAESATTPVKQARPVILGMQTMAATAAVGAAFTPDINITFDTPITFYPGEYVTVTITPMVAYTIGADQELIFTMTPIGYWK